MKRFKTALCLILVLVMCAAMFAACNQKEEIIEANETKALVLQESTFDGIFNPFFASSAYDVEVYGLVSASLLSMDVSGAVVAGDDYPTVAQSYDIYFTDTDGNKKETYPEGGYVVYKMVLKNGMKFSDGSAITADDVLFNYYVYLDPAYDGSSTLYTLPILGLENYQFQVADANTVVNKAAAILAAGKDHTWSSSDNWSEEEQTFYWESIASCGEKFAQSIIDYVAGAYGTDDDVAKYMHPSKTAADVKASAALTNAFGMRMWGFGSFTYDYFESADGAFVGVKNDDGTYSAKSSLKAAMASEDFASFTEAADGAYVYDAENKKYVAYEDGAEGTRYNSALKEGFLVLDRNFKGFKSSDGVEYTLEGDDYPKASDYFTCIENAYEGDYQNADDTETAGTYSFITGAKNAFVAKFGENKKIESIEGIYSKTEKIDGADHEVVYVTLTEQNPKAILSLGVTVAPKAYYTKDYKYTDGAVVTAGVELNSSAFMDQLKKFNKAPMGAGAYKMDKGANGAFFEDNVVYFVRNEYFDTMGGDNVYNAKIKYVHMKVVDSGAEYSALEAGEVMYATVSATSDVMQSLSTSKKLDSVLVDNNGYGYIVINPVYYPNLNTRIALTTLFNLNKITDYYPNGLAQVIYRSQSQVSWAYPENASAIYPYDSTGASAKTYFEKAGYKFENDVMIDPATGAQAEFVFTLPSTANDHPAGGIFIETCKLLESMGAKAEIKSDANLIANIKTDESVAVYALAWQSTADPDMYQVYHYKSQADSVKSNGIVSLHSSGVDSEGMLSIKKLTGETVEMNQINALNYLAELIEEGTKYMLAEERKPIYEKALEVLAQLSIEVPTYQRKNLFVYDKTLLDASSLSDKVSPYWGPMAENWKTSFVKDAK